MASYVMCYIACSQVKCHDSMYHGSRYLGPWYLDSSYHDLRYLGPWYLDSRYHDSTWVAVAAATLEPQAWLWP